jgi:bifunctional DNase/RNase
MLCRLVLQIDDGSQKMVSLDLRPSDAINLAVRCKVWLISVQDVEHIGLCFGL